MIHYLKMPFVFFWKLLKTLQTLLFGLLALGLVVGLFTATFSNQQPIVPDAGALVLNLSGYVVEAKTSVDPFNVLAGGDAPEEVLLSDVQKALEKASNDDRITTLVLELDNFYGGLMPHLELIADDIAAFRASGKKVIAASRGYEQSALLLAVEADEILMDPEYAALPEGYAAYRTYFKSFLDRFNITINLFKVGQYKSAAEPYIQDAMSEEDKEARLAYLMAWWKTYTDRVEQARNLSPGQVDQSIVDVEAVLTAANGNLAQVALDTGLVDRLLTEWERDEYLISVIGEDPEDDTQFAGIDYQSYLIANPDEPVEAEHKIAVITAVGNIIDGQAEPGTIGSLTMLEQIAEARADDQVKAMVIRIDSGGGSKSASEMIRQALVQVQKDGTPVIASMGSVAASGGYWIAASADKIFAHSNTITGSIGIFGLVPTFEKALAELGIRGDGVATTQLAGSVSLDRGIDPLYARLLTRIIESGYEQFLTVVAEGRSMTVDEVDTIAQGRVWTGEAAQPLGLVDAIGDLEAAVNAAAELAGIEDYGIWHVGPKPSKRQQIVDALTSELQAIIEPKTQLADRILGPLKREANNLALLNDPQHVYVLCDSCPKPGSD